MPEASMSLAWVCPGMGSTVLTSDHMMQSHVAAAVPQGRPDLSAVILVYP